MFEERQFPADEVRQTDLPNETPAEQPQEAPAATEPAAPSDSADAVGVEHANGTAAPAKDSWRAEAGRKGARRIHQLIERGQLYEREHGLKSGRQRLRQLIEEGKRYEEEHGLAQEGRRARSRRAKRVRTEEVLLDLLQAVLRLAKPRFRPKIARLIEAMEADRN